MEYQKIDTLFKRDDKNIIIPTKYTNEVFAELADIKWECTEKIDGTNTRIELKHGEIQFMGRTDKAVLPEHLTARLNEIFTYEKLKEVFNLTDDGTSPDITIFGEGYGAKIQKGNNYIKNGVDFILFDVRIGNWWLERDSLVEIADKLGVKIVPLIGYMTLPEAVAYVKKGFKSTIAENKDYPAEGLVLKTKYGLLYRNGQRIITKI